MKSIRLPIPVLPLLLFVVILLDLQHNPPWSRRILAWPKKKYTLHYIKIFGLVSNMHIKLSYRNPNLNLVGNWVQPVEASAMPITFAQGGLVPLPIVTCHIWVPPLFPFLQHNTTTIGNSLTQRRDIIYMMQD